MTLPATLLTRYGVEVRQVSPGHNESWTQAVSQAVNRSTRIVLFSHVSFRTGRRFDAEAIATACRDQGAQWIVLDASQSLGAVPVPATACDFVVSTGFKWQLGAHGAAILYWNRERTGDVKPRDMAGTQHQTHLPRRPGTQEHKTGAPRYIGTPYNLNPVIRLIWL